ncbi:MAG: BA14K family protein [Sulfitobacter sp.]
MPAKFKKTRSISAFVIALSLITPSANATSFQALSAARSMPVGITEVIEGSKITPVDHRRWHNAGPNQNRRGADRDRSGRRVDRNRNQRRVEREEELRRQARAERQLERRRAERQRERRRVERAPDRPRYRHGHRGYSAYRPGYRRDNDGWWYPLAAFALGAVILNEQNRNNSSTPSYSNWNHIPAGNMNAHDNWCDQKYRSYDRSSKTFQPYNGPRKYCNSPYDRL